MAESRVSYDLYKYYHRVKMVGVKIKFKHQVSIPGDDGITLKIVSVLMISVELVFYLSGKLRCSYAKKKFEINLRERVGLTELLAFIRS